MSVRVAITAVVIALLSIAAPARAQITPLARGWWMHGRLAVSGIEDIACGRERAYVRNWFGNVAEWNGTSWSELPRRAEAMYGRSLGVTPEGQVFLEASGAIAQWNGRAWIDHPLDRWQGDVDSGFAAPSAREAYYVGRGRIARFDGAAFHTHDAGTWRALTAVALAGDDVLVGGQGGTILRNHAGAWTRERTGIETWVRQLVAFAPDDVWARADGATWQQATVLHYDGRAWTRRDPPSAITSIGGAPDRFYATGDFGLMRWDGTAWASELAAGELGEGYHSLVGVCATATHVIVADAAGNALMRAR